MATENYDLTLRRHDRYLGDYPGVFSVSSSSDGGVRVSRSMLSQAGAVAMRVVDLSRGGVGVRCPLYLPRGCELQMRLTIPGPTAFTIQTQVIVQRVRMLDCVPNYYIGTAFELSDAAAEGKVAAMMEHLKAIGAVLDTEVRRAS